jgi:hypothetical protein
MSFLHDLLKDLREKRLWPVVVVLIGALVAVPVLLAKPAPKSPASASTLRPASSGGTSAPTGLPVVSVAGAHARSRLNGHKRDPFTQSPSKSTTPSASTATATTTPGGSGSPTSGQSTTGTAGASTGTTGSGTGGTGAGTTVTPAPGQAGPTIPLSKPTPAPPGLTATESYHVTVEITNGRGGVDKIDPLERFGILPRPQQPLLIELGVLNGGHRVLFVVQPDAVLTGPGRCLPGPIDCQILTLGQDQVEGLSARTPTGVSAVAQFAVTGITADRHASVAAALAARRQVSAAGQRLVRNDAYSAGPLFQFQLGAGAVIDLRDLTAGAS